jgi:hypothetical protein
MYKPFASDLRYQIGRFSEYANAVRLRDALAQNSIASRIDTRANGAEVYVMVAREHANAARYIKDAEFA